MKIIDPTCDLNSWIDNNPHKISKYTRERIRSSYDIIQETLLVCDNAKNLNVLDAGCGAGFYSFALGKYFKQVLAIDKDKNAINEATRIARNANIKSVIFKNGNLENFETDIKFDLIFCHLVSQNLPSRCQLLNTLIRLLNKGGYIIYSEETEGYAPMEIHDAINQRNEVLLILRLRQMLRGILGKNGFRFFNSGSMQPILEGLGIQLIKQDIQKWNNLCYSEMTIGKLVNHNSFNWQDADPDYVCFSPEFKELRQNFKTFLNNRSDKGFTELQKNEINRLANAPDKKFNTFLLLLFIIDIVPQALKLENPILERIFYKWLILSKKIGIPINKKLINWDAVENYFAIYLKTLKEVS